MGFDCRMTVPRLYRTHAIPDIDKFASQQHETMPTISLRVQIALAFLSIYTIWGSTYLAIRIAIETLPPFLMAGTRFLIAGAALYLWTRLRGAPRPTRSNWKAATMIGGLLLPGGNGG